MREMQAGDKALVLLPTAKSNLLMQWRGLFPVVERVGATDNRVCVGDNEKIYQINMLKKYYESAGGEHDGSRVSKSEEGQSNVDVVAAAVVEEGSDDVELSVPGRSSQCT